MVRLRSALRAIAMTWLIAQSVALASTPLLLSMPTEEVQLECECTHGPNAICPMHHKPAKGANVCAIGSIDTGLAALSSVFHVTSLALAPAKAALLTFAHAIAIEPMAVSAFDAVPPDPPPPRA
jgi:hypothetical protein